MGRISSYQRGSHKFAHVHAIFFLSTQVVLKRLEFVGLVSSRNVMGTNGSIDYLNEISSVGLRTMRVGYQKLGNKEEVIA